MIFSNLFLDLAFFLIFYIGNAGIFYVNQQSTADPAFEVGSWTLPFANLSSAIIKNQNISDFVLILANTVSAYKFPDSLPENSKISIEPLMYVFILFFIFLCIN